MKKIISLFKITLLILAITSNSNVFGMKRPCPSEDPDPRKKVKKTDLTTTSTTPIIEQKKHKDKKRLREIDTDKEVEKNAKILEAQIKEKEKNQTNDSPKNKKRQRGFAASPTIQKKQKNHEPEKSNIEKIIDMLDKLRFRVYTSKTFADKNLDDNWKKVAELFENVHQL